MLQRSLCALLLALVLLLAACSPGAGSAGADPPDVPVPDAGSASSENALPALSPQPEPQPVLTQADVAEALERVMEHYSAAGVSVATVERGRLSQAGAWGWAVKGQREMTPDTKVRIASVSKVVVALCAAAMAEDGLIDLDAPISDYWGTGAVNPHTRDQPTARTLMTHTSSLKELPITRGLSRLRGLLQSQSSWRSVEPGEGRGWSYSNFGMCILGATLELASGQVLDDYLQARLLAPLDARASFFGGRLKADEVATLYSGDTVTRTAAAHAGQPVPTQIGQGASYFPGGYTTSAVDMAKLVAVLANDGVYQEPVSGAPGTYTETRLLTQQSVADLEAPRFTVDLADYSSFDQCLILRRQEDIMGQEALYYHTGSAYGVFSLISYNPNTKNGVVVITTGARRNMNERGMYALCYDLMELLYARMEEGPV